MRKIFALICITALLSITSVTAQTTTSSAESDLPDCQPIEQQLEETKEYAEEILDNPNSTEEEKEEARRDIERMERSVQECILSREYEKTEPEGRCERIQHSIEYTEERLALIPEEEAERRDAIKESVEEDRERLERCRLNKEYREDMPANKCENIQHQIEYTRKRMELEEDESIVEEMKKDMEKSQELLKECRDREEEIKEKPCGEIEQKVRDLQAEMRMVEGDPAQDIERKVQEAIERHEQCRQEHIEKEENERKCMNLQGRLRKMMLRKKSVKDDLERTGNPENMQQLEEMDESIEEVKKSLESCEDVEIPTPQDLPEGECAMLEMQLEQQKKMLGRMKENAERTDGKGFQERIEQIKPIIAEAEIGLEWCREEKELEDSMSRCEVMEKKLEFYRQNADSDNMERRITRLEDSLESCRSMEKALSSKCGYLNFTLQKYKEGFSDGKFNGNDADSSRKVIRQFERGLRGCQLVTGEDAQCKALDDELSDQSDYIEKLEDQNEELRKRLEEAGETVPDKVERKDKERSGFLSMIFGRIIG